MNFNIVFHDDVDGVISAAIFLHNVVKGNRYQLHPVSSIMRGEKFDKLVNYMSIDNKEEKLIILDYENHPKSDTWIDHHFSPSIGEEAVHSEKIHYDPKSKSAARLVHEATYGLEKYNSSFLNTVDKIDQAEYESVEEIFSDNSPLMILRACLERIPVPHQMIHGRIVEMISRYGFNFHESLWRMDITDDNIFIMNSLINECSKNLTIFNKISTLYQKRINQFPRYAEYKINPEIKYAIRFTNSGHNQFNFQIGYNKWYKEPNNINLRELILSSNLMLKSGGHFNVAAGMIHQDNVDKLIEYINLNLDNGDYLMDKYAVDSTDPVEMKAEEMVKTGEVKTIPDAREKVVEEKKTEVPDAGSNK